MKEKLKQVLNKPAVKAAGFFLIIPAIIAVPVLAKKGRKALLRSQEEQKLAERVAEETKRAVKDLLAEIRKERGRQ